MMIERIKSAIGRLILNHKWRTDAKNLCGESTSFLPDLKGKKLFVIPHADDELLSSWKIIKKYKESSFVFYCGMTGPNDTADNKKVRDNEIFSFTNDKNYNFISSKNWKNELIDVIDQYDIDYLFIPSYIDWHPEHRLINTVLLMNRGRLKKNISIYWYSVTIPIQSKSSDLMPLERDEQKLKYKDFQKYYISQKNMPVTRFKQQEIINANNMSCYAAEAFFKVSFDDIHKAIESLDESELNGLKDSLNDLNAIRDQSHKLYVNVKG